MHFFSFFRLFLLAAVLLQIQVFAYFGKSNTGQAAFTWVANLQSPRNAALEGAGSAVLSEDPGVVIANPAALQSTSVYQLAASWQSGDLADRQGLVQFAHPFYSGRLLHSYGFVDNGEVEGYNEDGDATGLSHYPLAQMYAATFISELPHFYFGITGRLLWERLSQTESAQAGMAASMDWGLIWKSPSPRYGVALSARNLGAQFRPFVENGSNGHPLSSNLALSAFLRPANLPRLTVMTECDAPRYAPVTAKLGGEYVVGHSVFLRAGMQRSVIDLSRKVQALFRSESAPDETGTHRLFSLGAGYNARWFTVDYAYSHLFEGMGAEHRLGLRSGF